jgi:hypothetical protein
MLEVFCITFSVGLDLAALVMTHTTSLLLPSRYATAPPEGSEGIKEGLSHDSPLLGLLSSVLFLLALTGDQQRWFLVQD